MIALPFPLPFGLRWLGAAAGDRSGVEPAWQISLPALGQPRFLVLCFDAHGCVLDLTGPAGTGLEATARPGPSPAVCIVAVRSLPHVQTIRLRFATANGGRRPVFWTTSNPARLRRAIGRAKRGAAGPIAITCLGRDPLWRFEDDSAALSRTYSGTEASFYDEVLGLSAMQLAAEEASAPVPAEPLVSFVAPVYDTPPRYLDDLLASFRRQAGSAELVLSDDGSTAPATAAWLKAHAREPGLRIVRTAANGGIAAATNAGIAAAGGRWIGLIDHDDALSPDTTAILTRAIQARPDAHFFYTDEVITNDRLHPVGHAHKPAFDPVLLSGVNYINHLSLYRRDRLLALGGLREGFQGSQDYELLLRYLQALAPPEIVHVPYPAYLWRRSGKTFSATFIATATAHARKALAAHYAGADGTPALVDGAGDGDLHRVRFDLTRTTWPRVSVIVPNRDAFALMSRLFADLTTRTDYPDLEIIVVDNGTTDPDVLALYDRVRHAHPAVRIEIEATPFNFSQAINKGCRLARGAHLLLLNNDIEILDPGWLREMVACFDYPNVGIVGAKLLYPDRTLQHAGVIVGLGGLAGHWFGGMAADTPGPLGRLRVRQSLSAATGACLLVSRACFDAVGPFDERLFAIAYNDVDFCLRAIAGGWRVVWTPFATLVHHESASRGSDETAQNLPRFRREQANLRDRHATGSLQDRAYNPWYARHHSRPHLRMNGGLPEPRN